MSEAHRTTEAYVRSAHRRQAGDKASWRLLLEAEEERCRRTGFRAGVLSLEFGPSSADFDWNDPHRTVAILETVFDHLNPTDQVCTLSAHEIGVLLIPVDTVHEVEGRAIELDAALKANGIDLAIGWALRRPDAGLFDAAARADANAAVAHQRALRLLD